MERIDRLFSAVEKESQVDVRILLEQGVDPLAFHPVTGMNAIGLAASLGNANILTRLIESVNPPPSSMGEKNSSSTSSWMDLDLSTPEGMGDLEWDEEIDAEKCFSPDKEWLDLYSYYARMWENIGQVLDVSSSSTSASSILPLLRDVHTLDRQQQAPLHYAAKFGHWNCVRLLLTEFRCPVDLQTYSGQTALHLACEYKHRKVVRLLLQSGANVNLKTFKVEDTALLKAAKNGNNSIVLLLLDHGAAINSCNAYDVSPLIGAAFFGHEETVKLLVERGANVNFKDRDGLTALVIAVHNEATETVRFLLNHGAKVIPSHQLIHTAVNLGNDEILRMLIEAGEQVTRGKDSYGLTPLDKLIQRGNVEMVEFCYEFFGLRRDAYYDSGRELLMALHCDDLGAFERMVRFLLRMGRRVDENETFLSGIKLRKLEHLKVLLKENLKVTTEYDEEVLEMLRRDTEENVEMVAYLVASGFKIHQLKSLRTKWATGISKSRVDRYTHHVYTNPRTLQDLTRIKIRSMLKDVEGNSDKVLPSQIDDGKTPFERDLWLCGLPPSLVRFIREFPDLQATHSSAMMCESTESSS